MSSDIKKKELSAITLFKSIVNADAVMHMNAIKYQMQMYAAC